MHRILMSPTLLAIALVLAVAAVWAPVLLFLAWVRAQNMPRVQRPPYDVYGVQWKSPIEKPKEK